MQKPPNTCISCLTSIVSAAQGRILQLKGMQYLLTDFMHKVGEGRVINTTDGSCVIETGGYFFNTGQFDLIR